MSCYALGHHSVCIVERRDPCACGPGLRRRKMAAAMKVPVGSPAVSMQRQRRTARPSRARKAVLLRSLSSLEAGLRTMDRQQRLQAIQGLHWRVRRALLDHMEVASRAAAPKQQEVCSKPAAAAELSGPSAEPEADETRQAVKRKLSECKSSSQADELSKLRTDPHRQPRRCKSGVRSVPTGLFQASTCFEHLLVRSRTTQCCKVAARMAGALQRLRQLVLQGTRDERCALEPSAGWRKHANELEAHVGRALRMALDEAQMPSEELRPSYCAYVHAGCLPGKVESPTTASFEQALAWRRNLVAAKDQGWPCLRAAWVQVLQEGGRCGLPLSRPAAEAHVDAARRRRQLRQLQCAALRRGAGGKQDTEHRFATATGGDGLAGAQPVPSSRKPGRAPAKKQAARRSSLRCLKKTKRSTALVATAAGRILMSLPVH